MSTAATARQRTAVIGGGIAGLAAALRLAEHGFPVTLVERRPVLGGRASAFPIKEEAAAAGRGRPGSVREKDYAAGFEFESQSADRVDNCQHVLMRCCVNLVDFYRRIGAVDSVEFFDRFTFVDRQGRWSTLAASPWLPAPLHLLPSLFRFRSMGVVDKAAIAYGMARLIRMTPKAQQDHKSTFAQWLRCSRQTPNAIECFWRPVVVSALNEEPENTAAAYAFQLFRQAFLRGRRAFEMGLPRVGLADIYSSSGGEALRRLGVTVLAPERATRIAIENGRVSGVQLSDRFLPAEIVVSAVPQHTLPGLLDPEIRNRAPFLDLASFETSPITGIHLWFDRSVTDCPHVALLGREMQWIFAKHVQNLQNSPERSPQSQPGSYLGLVVSASRGLTSRTREEIIGMALDAVHDVFPASREARVIRGVVIREPRATFSPCPGAEALRPPARTPIQGLYLAGDWTRTRWPATMEGAVRGGYLAAEAILRDDGQEASLLCPEMPPDTLPRLLGL